MNEQEFVSSDGELRLLVIVPGGDLTIGFNGYPSHIHGTLLAGFYKCDEAAATTRYVTDILENKLVIAIQRTLGIMSDAWVPETNYQTIEDVVSLFRRYREQNETVEFRLWDGTKIETPAVR